MQLEADSVQQDNLQLTEQSKALQDAQQQLADREEEMRMQLESEKKKVRPEPRPNRGSWERRAGEGAARAAVRAGAAVRAREG